MVWSCVAIFRNSIMGRHQPKKQPYKNTAQEVTAWTFRNCYPASYFLRSTKTWATMEKSNKLILNSNSFLFLQWFVVVDVFKRVFTCYWNNLLHNAVPVQTCLPKRVNITSVTPIEWHPQALLKCIQALTCTQPAQVLISAVWTCHESPPGIIEL